jgi:hypothetical protein
MRVLITSLNLKHGVNPIVHRLFQPLWEFRPTTVDDCDAIFLSFIAPPCDFQLDKPLLEKIINRGVPVVVFDHSEVMGSEFILGIGSMHDSNEYIELHRAVRSLKVKAYFKRELLAGFQSPVPYPIYPLDWTIPNFAEHGAVDTREQFDARPIDIFMSWGYSSESRPRLYGELMRKAGKFCAHFALSAEDVDRSLADKRERIFALLFAPVYRRIRLEKLLEWQKKSKLTVSLKGCGIKCFRCAEGSFNSLLVQQAPETVQWSYPWVDGQNCIGLANGPDGEVDEVVQVEDLYHHLRITQGSLYDVYLRGLENNKRYRMDTYARNYLLPKLAEALK